MFKGLSNLGALLKQAHQFSGQMDKLSAELKARRATGTAGGGMVEVEINGLLEVVHCRIEPQLFAQGDRELVEDLLVAAFNQAVSKGKQQHAAALKELTGGLQLPGLQDALEKLVGAGDAGADDPDAGPDEGEK
jgi:hypothetical protein